VLTRPRTGFLLTALLAVLVLATACAEADRTVSRKYRVSSGSGSSQPALLWQSNRYPDFEARVSEDCWAEAEVGATVPDGCVSPASTILEGSAFRTNQRLAFLGSLIAIGAMLAFALRRIAWQPDVEPEPVKPPAEADTPSAAQVLQLMRVVNTEKDAETAAVAAGHDIPRPGLVGSATALVAVVLLTALVGYGAALGWAAITAIFIFAGLGLLELAVLLPTPLQISGKGAVVSRMYFALGIAATFIVLVLVGAAIPTPLTDLHGLAWLG